MQKRRNGSAVWFSSALFEHANAIGYPQPVQNSVDISQKTCGKPWKTPAYTLRHGFSTRYSGGASTDPAFADLNFGFSAGEARETVAENYRRFATALGIAPDHPTCAAQTHTGLVFTVTEQHRGMGVDPAVSWPDGIYADGFDALVTACPDIALTIRTADCVPLLFWDPMGHVIGAAHAGWKGTCERIAEKTVAAMEALGADRSRILVCIGSAIGACCYEIDDAFHQRFLDTFGEALCGEVFFSSPVYPNPERLHCDLRRLNALLLQNAGVPAAHIEVFPFCTCCQPQTFFSHRYAVRYQNGRRGLLGAMISMESTQS